MRLTGDVRQTNRQTDRRRTTVNRIPETVDRRHETIDVRQET